MDIMIFFYIVIFLFSVTLQVYLNYKFSKVESDDKLYHNLLINLIKQNEGKMVLKHTNLINENLVSYPQLMHWLIANMPDKVALWFRKYNGSIFFTIQLLFFQLFVSYVFLINQDDYSLESQIKTLTISMLLLISIPYHYNSLNAKNYGLSARLLGVLLGQLVLYGAYIYLISNNLNYLFFCVFFGLFIFFSSQFATQFYVFVFILFAIFFMDFWFIITLVTSLFLFIALGRKIAINSLIGQINHKINYHKYHSQSNIFNFRKSIWGDFIYEIPKRFFWLLINFNGYRHHLIYIFENPVLIVVLQMPIILLAIYYGQTNIIDLIFIISGICLFIMFSFKKTRFLGEPERYLEFFLPIALVVLIKSIGFESHIIWVVIFFSCIISIYNLIQLNNNCLIYSNRLYLNKIKAVIDNVSNPVILSNDYSVSRYFQDKNVKIFIYYINSLECNGLKYPDVYGSNRKFISETNFHKILEKYPSINTLIINTLDFDISKLEKTNLKNIQKHFKYQHFIVYHLK